MGCDPARVATVAIAYPDVAGIDESEMVLRDRRLAQQPGFGVVRCGGVETIERQCEGECPTQDPPNLHRFPLLMEQAVALIAATIIEAPGRVKSRKRVNGC